MLEAFKVSRLMMFVNSTCISYMHITVSVCKQQKSDLLCVCVCVRVCVCVSISVYVCVYMLGNRHLYL